MKYIGFWARFFAYLIDSFICGFIGGIIGFFIGLSGAVTGAEDSTVIIAMILAMFAGLCYVIILPATSLQGTLGKVIIGAKIVDTNGERISILRSLGRYLSMFLSSFFYIGYIMIGFHSEKRGLHDLIAGTYVVKR